MREILTVVNRRCAMATKRELARIGCAGYSQFPVLGRGRQRGLRNQAGQEVVSFLPKVLFDVVVEDEEAQETIEAFIRANQTGQYGDGKIFVLEVCEAYRISTGEQPGTTDVKMMVEAAS
ncbi:MAG: P-II family nitrogen regulator [Candidatus Omnitrophica bacterium]|nr:P-II family nitrogen regulator [Candidatus Omnitrophota bacterium]